MASFNGKRTCLALALAGPLVLGAAEPAFAHVTSLQGTMVVTGNASGTSTAVSAAHLAACSSSSGGAQATSSGGSVGITVSPAPANGSCPSDQLKAGAYKVFYLNNAGLVDSPAFACIHQWAFNPNPSLGTLQVNSSGNGSGTYALPNGLAVTPTDGATICITDEMKDAGPYAQVHGQAAPLTIVP